MKKIGRILLIVLLVLGIGAAIVYRLLIYQSPPPISPGDRAAIQLMPLPSVLELGEGAFDLKGSLGVQYLAQKHAILEKAVERFLGRKPLEEGERLLSLKVESIRLPIPHKADESYKIRVSKEKIEIISPNQLGALHALESLAQLKENGQIPVCEISDAPRFPWRGLMLDVSRHWYPKELVLRNLDAMAAVRMNVLHLHLSDYQAFRIESKRYPKLHELGSRGNYYSQEDLGEIISYARDRGIRIIPEFDVPGHMTSWFVGYPELASSPGPYELSKQMGLGKSVLDPSREEVYEFLDNFLGEMSRLFPDEYLHIGGDEVSVKEWEENEVIQGFMQEQGLKDEDALRAYLNQRLQGILQKHGKKMIGWDEVLHPDLEGKGMLIHSWRGHKSLFSAVQDGHEGILSAGWYLDHKLAAAKMYEVDPFVLKGAITIEPDSTNWKSWDIKISMSEEQSFEGQLFLFGEKDQLRGYVGMMDRLNSFETATLDNGLLKTSITADVGKIDIEGNIEKDKISGSFSLGVFSLDMQGERSGGSDMPEGIAFPKIEKTKALTESDKSRILGGEACMWSEVVDQYTAESRIWPRTAVVAEKLWSNPDLANDEEDMYRRLSSLEAHLLNRGIQSEIYRIEILKGLVTNGDISAIEELASILEEDKYYGRLGIYGNDLPIDMPLDELVDATRPESPKARAFNLLVEAYLEDPQQENLLSQITIQLQNWASLEERLAGNINPDKTFSDIEEVSHWVSYFSEAALKELQAELSEEETEKILAELTAAKAPIKGVLIQILPGIEKLLMR